MYNPFGKVSIPRPKHTGAKPLPNDKDVWASEHWDEVKQRKLAAILHEAAQGGDKFQVLADAIRQASSTSYFVPDRFLKRIEDAMSFDFEQRPHASIGEPPVGQPVEHLKLLAELGKLRTRVNRLKDEGASQQRFFKARRVLSPIFEAFQTSMRVLQAVLDEIRLNEKELSAKHGGDCSCKVCFGITFQLKVIGKDLGDIALSADMLKRHARTAEAIKKLQQRPAPRQTPATAASATPPRLAPAPPSARQRQASALDQPSRRRSSLLPPRSDDLARIAKAVEGMNRGMRQMYEHMPHLSATLDRVERNTRQPSLVRSAAQNTHWRPFRQDDQPINHAHPNGRRREAYQRGGQSQDQERLVILTRELAAKLEVLAQCKAKMGRTHGWERNALTDFAMRNSEEIGDLRRRIEVITRGGQSDRPWGDEL